MVATVEAEIYLPNECWDCIFKFLINDNNGEDECLKSLSVVSKQFLTITNSLQFTLKVSKVTWFHQLSISFYVPSISSLLNRFSNLHSLHLTYHFKVNLNMLLCQISTLPLKNLKSLHFFCHYNLFPANGLRVFSKNITTLTSLTCSGLHCLNSTYLFLIADCFPFLEELNIPSPRYLIDNESLLDGLEALSSALSKIRKVDLTGHRYINDQMLIHLFKNWKLLEDAILLDCYQITNDGIASSLRERPTLKSLYFSEPEYCEKLFPGFKIRLKKSKGRKLVALLLNGN